MSTIGTERICPKCQHTGIVSVEYGYPHPQRYDGISEYQCGKCGYREGRWTGAELGQGECEPRFGEIRNHQGKYIKVKHGIVVSEE